jgi:hypothetical protein
MRKMIAGMKVRYAMAEAALVDRPEDAATCGALYGGAVYGVGGAMGGTSE